MFLVFNKEKIYAYIVSLVTVCLLFFIASNSTETITQTTSTIEFNTTQNNIENTLNNTAK